jgi:hypothetical protein
MSMCSHIGLGISAKPYRRKTTGVGIGILVENLDLIKI